MIQNTIRHPNCWPTSAPAGTPRTFAIVRPANRAATADARFEAGTRARRARLRCRSSHRARARRRSFLPIITSYVGAQAESRFPTTKNASSTASAYFGGRRMRKGVMINAPGTTASA